MTHQQYKNLCSSFRWAIRRMSFRDALAWIGHYNERDARIMYQTYATIAGVTD